VQANSSDWSAQSRTPLHCFPSGTQLASDQHINSVCTHPADDGCVLAVTTDDNLWSVLIVDVDVAVDGVLSPTSTSITLTTSHSSTQSLSTHCFLIFSYCLSTDWDNHWCGVRVGDPRSLGFGPEWEKESLIWKRLRLWALSVSSGLSCNFVAVSLTLAFVQFILQLKLCTLLCTFY